MFRPPFRALQIVLRVFSVLLAVGGVFMILASKPLIIRVFLRPPESEARHCCFSSSRRWEDSCSC